MSPPVVPPVVLRPKAAAQFLGLSVATLARMRVDGNGPAFVQLHPRAIGYTVDSLREFVASRPTYRSTSERTTAARVAA